MFERWRPSLFERTLIIEKMKTTNSHPRHAFVQFFGAYGYVCHYFFTNDRQSSQMQGNPVLTHCVLNLVLPEVMSKNIPSKLWFANNLGF